MNLVAIDVLLGLGVAAELLCCLGFVLMRDTFDRLHFVSASTSVGPLLILAAILIADGATSQSADSVAAVALLFLLGPVLTHATARAARRVRFGQVGARPEERKR
jgi:monovalent cation/proton antiporter MnhG/PhaG subunit